MSDQFNIPVIRRGGSRGTRDLEMSASEFLDNAFGATQGITLIRGATYWGTQAAGTATVGYGPGASKPSPGTSGNLYIPTDGTMTSIDTGSSWVGLNPLGEPYTIPPTYANWTGFHVLGTISDIPGGGISFIGYETGSSEAVQGITRTPANAASYTAIACMSCLLPATGSSNSYDYGIFCTDGTKLLYLRMDSTSAASGNGTYLLYSQYSNYATAGSNLGTWTFQIGGGPAWFKMANDGTHRTVSISRDGIAWIQLYQESSGTYLTETAVGVAQGSVNSTNLMTATLLSWSGA